MIGIIWDAIIDHIPVWGWIVIIAVPSAAVLWFCYPILLPIWKLLPTPVKVALGAILAGFLAYMGGRYRGRGDAEEQERRRNAEALQKRTEVDSEVDRLGAGEADKKLRDRWSKPPSG